LPLVVLAMLVGFVRTYHQIYQLASMAELQALLELELCQ